MLLTSIKELSRCPCQMEAKFDWKSRVWNAVRQIKTFLRSRPQIYRIKYPPYESTKNGYSATVILPFVSKAPWDTTTTACQNHSWTFPLLGSCRSGCLHLGSSYTTHFHGRLEQMLWRRTGRTFVRARSFFAKPQQNFWALPAQGWLESFSLIQPVTFQ